MDQAAVKDRELGSLSLTETDMDCYLSGGQGA